MNHSTLLLWVLTIAGGFFLGSVMFCRILPQYYLNIDICACSDDHNPGASNVFIHCGPGWGMLCLFLDLFKGFLPVALACRYLGTESLLFSLVLAAPVLGHAIAPFHHFQGGKCIATAFGEMLALFPYNQIGILLAALYILFSTIVKIKPNRLRSSATFALFGLISSVILLYKGQTAIALGCIFISITALVKHSAYFLNKTQDAYGGSSDAAE